MKDILMPEEIRKAIECPELGFDHYGSWGILNSQQRLSINNLLKILDSADAVIRKQQKEIEELKNIASEFTNRNINQFSIGEFNFKVKHFKDNYISKDKIREYVNSPEFLDWHLGFTQLDELEYRKNNINKLLEE